MGIAAKSEQKEFESGMNQRESQSARRELLSPRGVGVLPRVLLWFRGMYDGRRGKVRLSKEGFLDSPFCRNLARRAELEIAAEWQECNGEMFELWGRLEKAVLTRDYLSSQQKNCEEEMREAIRLASGPIYEGDSEAGPHLAARRINRRVEEVKRRFEPNNNRLIKAVHKANGFVASLVTECRDCEDIARTHERVVRLDYLARLSAYAQGASRYIQIKEENINDKAVSDKQLREHESVFSRDLLDRAISWADIYSMGE